MIPYAVQQRLRLIDFLAWQYGVLNRSAIMDYFGISSVQASADIKQYVELAPRNLIYNNHTRQYERMKTFVRMWP